jgi:hypothetical protein
MSTLPDKQSHEIELKLTEDQRAQIIQLISTTKQANLQVEIAFEALPSTKAVAPVSVLVGNAI